jgi:hypothetical protein
MVYGQIEDWTSSGPAGSVIGFDGSGNNRLDGVTANLNLGLTAGGFARVVSRISRTAAV